METVKCETDKHIEEQLKIHDQNEKIKTDEYLNSISQQYEEQIQSLEYNLSWEKSQKLAADDEIFTLKADNETLESSMEQLKITSENNRIQSNFKHWYFMSKALSTQESLKLQLREIESILHHSRVKHEEKEQELKKKVKLMEQRAIAFEQRMKHVASTLLHHKRNELIEHKTKSRNVSVEIKKVSDKIEVTQSKKSEMSIVLSHLEEEMKIIEMRLQEHSQTSAIQGGKINLNHARKKRRLDEE